MNIVCLTLLDEEGITNLFRVYHFMEPQEVKLVVDILFLLFWFSYDHKVYLLLMLYDKLHFAFITFI